MSAMLFDALEIKQTLAVHNKIEQFLQHVRLGEQARDNSYNPWMGCYSGFGTGGTP